MTSQRTQVCPTCKRNLPAEATFCGFDGTVLNPAANKLTRSKTGSIRKYCPQCHKYYPPYAAFCSSDRTALVFEQEATQMPGAGIESTAAWTGAQEDDRTVMPNRAQSGSIANSPPQATRGGQNQVQSNSPSADFDEEGDEVLASSGGYMTNLIGKTIDGKYLIESMLGEGGMAVVYKSHHTLMERQVVIKVMQGWLLSNKKSIERFQRECKVTAKLNHPNIVTVYDVGDINGKAPYLVMEYIQGESLADKIHRQGALSFETTADIIIQLCSGLQEAHTAGIIHRDLKPDNVLLQNKSDRPDWVKIVDFGISHLVHGQAQRLTKTGRMVGTPEYIAPEQLKDKPMDMRTDLYALGIMMYEMLTGTVPFGGESAEAILMKHLLEMPQPMSVHKPEFADGTPFDDIILKLLQKEPDHRYQTASELKLDVEMLQDKLKAKRA